jgi:hypothetical protein
MSKDTSVKQPEHHHNAAEEGETANIKQNTDYLFEEAERCFRRSRTASNMRVELEALGNMFMVKAVELDIKLQKLANDNSTARLSSNR